MKLIQDLLSVPNCHFCKTKLSYYFTFTSTCEDKQLLRVVIYENNFLEEISTPVDDLDNIIYTTLDSIHLYCNNFHCNGIEYINQFSVTIKNNKPDTLFFQLESENNNSAARIHYSIKNSNFIGLSFIINDNTYNLSPQQDNSLNMFLDNFYYTTNNLKKFL